MKPILFLFCVGTIMISCNQTQHEKKDFPIIRGKMSEAVMDDLNWVNKPETLEVRDSVLSVTALEGTDFFNNPEDSSIVATAPLLYKHVKGDFLAKALVKPDFSSQWNAVSMMVHIDNEHWIKFAFENSDATGPSVVTVVTKGLSDDANGAVLNDIEHLWLAIARKGNNYSMHWSADGKQYNMARLTSLPASEEVKIGLEMQSPVGATATHQIFNFDVSSVTVSNMRDLNE